MSPIDPYPSQETPSSTHSSTRLPSAHEVAAVIGLTLGLVAFILLIVIWLTGSETLSESNNWLARAAFDFFIMPVLAMGDVVFAVLGLTLSLAVVQYSNTRVVSIIGICSSSLTLAGLFVNFVSWMESFT
ncbi:hypothetical protein B9G55_04095 [Saccharibacillus sp. O16]|nr:hypothetical protein B9G55_04095 [Saccharibacillus sp. O16]